MLNACTCKNLQVHHGWSTWRRATRIPSVRRVLDRDAWSTAGTKQDRCVPADVALRWHRCMNSSAAVATYACSTGDRGDLGTCASNRTWQSGQLHFWRRPAHLPPAPLLPARRSQQLVPQVSSRPTGWCCSSSQRSLATSHGGWPRQFCCPSAWPLLCAHMTHAVPLKQPGRQVCSQLQPFAAQWHS